jgi:hypothetical protein
MLLWVHVGYAIHAAGRDESEVTHPVTASSSTVICFMSYCHMLHVTFKSQ